jgi:predicted PolB exonuclease-like 3'-5' exonuclease
MTTIVFDIETVPDIELGRKLLGLDGVNDEDTAKAMVFNNLQASGSDFLPLYQQQIVAISVVVKKGDQLTVLSLGDEQSTEADLIRLFYKSIDKYSPELVSWNGGGFDLPVLHYRGLRHKIQAPTYWDTGDSNREFKWNNYLSRFHWRHLDLMDVLAGFQPRARAGLDVIATMLGYPGKMGMAGDQVWQQYMQGNLAGIRNYCETDVLNTYLVYLRFQFMRGLLDEVQLEQEEARVKSTLADSGLEHLQEFLAAWNGDASA